MTLDVVEHEWGEEEEATGSSGDSAAGDGGELQEESISVALSAMVQTHARRHPSSLTPPPPPPNVLRT